MNGDTPVGSMQRSAREVKKVVDAIEEEGGDVVQVSPLRKHYTPSHNSILRQLFTGTH